MSRLFAFGCSFTNYRWMTWADILGVNFDHYQNWGQSGAGNTYIFNSIMEADQRHHFAAGDTVIVCWTNVTREDRYVKDRGWITLGNVTSSPIFTKEFIADAVCERGYLIRDLAMIKAAKTFLQHSGVRWRFLAMCPLTQPDPWDDKKISDWDVCDLYKDVIDSISPSYMQVLGHGYWQHDQHKRYRYAEGGVDYHPTSEEHLLYLDTVLPGWVTDSALRDKIAATAVVMNKRANGSCVQPRL
jgi:hypothetical protein